VSKSFCEFQKFFFAVLHPLLLKHRIQIESIQNGNINTTGISYFTFEFQPKQVKEIKDFLITARRKDAKSKIPIQQTEYNDYLIKA
jgi:hypothetical protein